MTTNTVIIVSIDNATVIATIRVGEGTTQAMEIRREWPLLP